MNTHWWGQFGAQVASPEWAANALQTLVGAGVAFGVAITVLRKQLDHDRGLARKQRQEDLALAVAQRHAEAAAILGRRAILGAKALENFDDPGLVACVRTRSIGTWVTDEIMPGLEDTHDLTTEISLVFGEGMASPFWKVWMLRLHQWEVFRRTLLKLDQTQEMGPTNSPDFEHSFYNAVDKRMAKTSAILKEIGKSWVRWDGTGTFPAGDAILGQRNFEGWPGHRESAAWAEAERAMFLRDIQEGLT
ncbi:hypothetical protein KHP11_27630 [Rhodococcus erythropolis]|uniref:hypothetical protein n=1 Tax=Rhodococcus erythropolis TaxID=1833 RepID=UPI00111304CA|nr:hypothetical protein [Rhodococcus erythropolis]MBT1258242.1 hypothetical protein [Rhodococcus erythropolis]